MKWENVSCEPNPSQISGNCQVYQKTNSLQGHIFSSIFAQHISCLSGDDCLIVDLVESETYSSVVQDKYVLCMYECIFPKGWGGDAIEFKAIFVRFLSGKYGTDQ